MQRVGLKVAGGVHVLMKQADNENMVLFNPVKNNMAAMLMTENPFFNIINLASHCRGLTEQQKTLFK